jgi:sporulation protein YlmC with PRC-barrel domain
MKGHSLDLLREVLDHEVVDADGISCGMVDDIALSNTADGPTVAALLIGPGASVPRLPAVLQWLAGKMLGHEVVRVPWDEIEHVAEVITLKSKASTLRLGRLERKAGAWLSRVPRS